MFGMGATEIIVIVILAFLLLGPERLPEAATKIGQAIRKLRHTSWEVQNELNLEESLKKPLTEIQSAFYTPIENLKANLQLVKPPEHAIEDSHDDTHVEVHGAETHVPPIHEKPITEELKLTANTVTNVIHPPTITPTSGNSVENNTQQLELKV